MSEPKWPNLDSSNSALTFDKIALEQIFRDYGEGKLPLNLAQEILKDLEVTENTDSWVSSARSEERGFLQIGAQAIPTETVKRWGWGVYEAGDQIHIKASHEYAHFIQDYFDRSLEAFIDRRMNRVKEEARPYIQLYSKLIEIGRISGLPEEEIYKRQTAELKLRGSDLNMSTYEDIAEVVGAWMLGEVYYNFRLDNSKTPLAIEQKNQLTELIEKVFETWALKKPQEA